MQAKLKKLMSSCLVLEHGISWSIGDETKNFLYQKVNKDTKSIETGIGYSTLIFAERGSNHTVCFPNPKVKDRIESYAQEADVSLKKINFVIGLSQFTLPNIKERFNFALIDGEHMFPCPTIDFYYINNLLDVDAFLVIDDLQIPAVRILYDFLIVSQKWSIVDIFDQQRCCAFKKLSHDQNEWWGNQEYNKKILKNLKSPRKLF